MGSSQFYNYLWAYILVALSACLGNVVDGVIVGNLISADAVSAINLSKPINQFLFTLHLLINAGAGMLVGYALGRKETARASTLFSVALTLSVGIGIVLALAGGLLFPGGIARLLCSNDNLLPLAADYMQVLLLGSPAFILMWGLSTMVGVDGQPRLVSVAVIVDNAVNLCLDLVFIQLFGWGIAGSSAATIAGHLVGIAILLSHWRAKLASPASPPNPLSEGRGGNLRWSAASPPSPLSARRGGTEETVCVATPLSSWRGAGGEAGGAGGEAGGVGGEAWTGVVGEAISSGAPLAIASICLTLLLFSSNAIILSTAGRTGIFAFAVCMNLLQVYNLFISGTCQTLQSLGATLVGSGDKQGLRAMLRRAFRFITVAMAVICLVVWLFPGAIAHLFGADDPGKLAETVHALRIFALSFIPFSYIYIVMIVYKLRQRHRMALFISFALSLTVIPVLWAISRFAPSLLWYSYLLAYAIEALAIWLLHKFIVKRKPTTSPS